MIARLLVDTARVSEKYSALLQLRATRSLAHGEKLRAGSCSLTLSLRRTCLFTGASRQNNLPDFPSHFSSQHRFRADSIKVGVPLSILSHEQCNSKPPEVSCTAQPVATGLNTVRTFVTTIQIVVRQSRALAEAASFRRPDQ